MSAAASSGADLVVVRSCAAPQGAQPQAVQRKMRCRSRRQAPPWWRTWGNWVRRCCAPTAAAARAPPNCPRSPRLGAPRRPGSEPILRMASASHSCLPGTRRGPAGPSQTAAQPRAQMVRDATRCGGQALVAWMPAHPPAAPLASGPWQLPTQTAPAAAASLRARARGAIEERAPYEVRQKAA